MSDEAKKTNYNSVQIKLIMPMPMSILMLEPIPIPTLILIIARIPTLTSSVIILVTKYYGHKLYHNSKRLKGRL